MADLIHRSSRTIEQAPGVVHDRLLELATRLRDEAPAIPAGSQAATFLGVSGPLGMEVADRGANRLELRTTEGRVRGEASAEIVGRPDGTTDLTLVVAVKPQGFAANLMLGAALGARPGLRQQIEDELERGFDDLAAELAKPDAEWDAATWQPPGVRARS